MEYGLEEGIRLFNSGQFFEAHEALETVWLKSEGHRKVFLQGLIQVAAAFHHYVHHNRVGFRSLLAKGSVKLDSVGAEAEGIDLAGLTLALQPWRELARGSQHKSLPAPPLPKIKLVAKPSAE